MKTLLFTIFSMLVISLHAQVTIVGKTTYAQQTNSGSKHRILAYETGEISAVWTGSLLLDAAHTDRGMFYNHYDGATWGALPEERVESIRTGYGEIMQVMDHEVIISHDFAGLNLRLYANETIGSDVWDELPGSGLLNGVWPTAYVPEGTDDVYVIYSNTSPPTALFFARSDDGGNTWAVQNSTLPYLTTADGIYSLDGESYTIVVHGNDVYIAVGATWTDLKILHSPDKGAPGTWDQTILLDFPIDNYYGLIGQNSDVDGDGSPDVIETTDGFHNMITSDDGVVHLFTPKYLLSDYDAFTEGWSYYPTANGMYYWNSTMAEPVLIDLLIDWNNDDGLNNPFGGIGSNMTMYSAASFTTMPGAAIDEVTGRIYLVYTMMVEYTDIFDDPYAMGAQSFRDLFGVYSDDNGATWSTPVNLTNAAELQKENVYPFVYPEMVNGKIHVVWMQDKDPGTNLDYLAAYPDPIGRNNIAYYAFTAEDFGDLPPCEPLEAPTGVVVSDITSTTASISWDAVPAAVKYVVKVYNVANPADFVKQTVSTAFLNASSLTPGADYAVVVKTVCATGLRSDFSVPVYFSTLLRVGNGSNGLTVYPNPASKILQLALPVRENTESRVLRLYTLTGELISAQFVDAGLSVVELNIQDLPSGSYHIMLMDGEKISTASFIKSE